VIEMESRKYKNLVTVSDCFDLMMDMPDGMFDLIVIDPPYNMSMEINQEIRRLGVGGIDKGQVLCEKGDWDKWDAESFDKFNYNWLVECNRLLKPNKGTIWVFASYHNLGYILYHMYRLPYYILNLVTLEKTNATPNFTGRRLCASTEFVVWARKSKKDKYYFNYKLAKQLNGGKQMRSTWITRSTPRGEKTFGKHPTQKPLDVLRRIVEITTEPGDLVFDPMCGSGTTLVAAKELNRYYVGCDLSPEFIETTNKRLEVTTPRLI